MDIAHTVLAMSLPGAQCKRNRDQSSREGGNVREQQQFLISYLGMGGTRATRAARDVKKKCDGERTDLHLLVHTHTDDSVDRQEQGRARCHDPCDDGQNEHHVGSDGISIAAVKGTSALVHAVAVVSRAI